MIKEFNERHIAHPLAFPWNKKADDMLIHTDTVQVYYLSEKFIVLFKSVRVSQCRALTKANSSNANTQDVLRENGITLRCIVMKCASPREHSPVYNLCPAGVLME
jgi:hypothetical protein